MTPADFLHSLYGHADEGHLTLFSIDSAGFRYTDWFSVDNLEQMAARSAELTDRNVWFGVATRREMLLGESRGGATDCLAAPGLWADIDIAGPNHRESTGLPADKDAALAMLAEFPLRPSIIVDTGGGLHPYWLFAEPVPAEQATGLLARWAVTWMAHAEARGLRVDNVFDLPRVLRVPGTTNQKNGAPVAVIEATGLLYGVDDIIEHTLEPPERIHRSERNDAPVLGIRPGDEFNQRHAGGYVLSMAGWMHSDTERNGNERWLHPWSPTSDCSATVYGDDGHTTIWSETAAAKTAIEVRRPYDPYGLYVTLIHDGDFNAAAKQLAAEGYGEPAELKLAPSKTAPRGKRAVQVNARSLDDLSNDIVDALCELNDPPTLFLHGDAVTQFDRGQLDPIDRVRLTHVVETSTSPVKANKDGELSPTRIDAQALDLTLYRLQHKLPAIEGVLNAPFVRSDGSICSQVGYDATSQMFLASTLPLAIPEEPGAADVASAVATIDELIADFPLEGDSDRAHVFAMLLTLVTRHLVPITPLFVFDGTGPGVGKNLLSECCVYVATGEWVQTDPLPLDAEEQRKHITALLASGRTVALFDEAHIVSGTSLARLITSTTWGDRLLGYSKQVSYPNRVTAIALGNNVEVHGDMPRRTILIRMASPLSYPELRQNFRHDDLRGWVTNHRIDVLGALLVLMRAWTAAGRPLGANRLGSFDQWSQMIGGVLQVAGVDGFLANADEMRERGATDDTDMGDHLAELRGHYEDWSFTTAEVAELLRQGRLSAWPPRVSTDDRKVAGSLGYAYRRVKGRWIGDCMLTQESGRSHNNRRKWQIVERAKPQESGDDGDDGDDGTPLYENSSSLYIGRSADPPGISGDGPRSSPSSPSSPDDTLPSMPDPEHPFAP